MSVEAIRHITPKLPNGQRFQKEFPHRPTAISALYSLTDIRERFGLDEYQVYKAAEEGKLHALRRHKRLFYAQWEVEALVRRKLIRKVGPANTPRRISSTD